MERISLHQWNETSKGETNDAQPMIRRNHTWFPYTIGYVWWISILHSELIAWAIHRYLLSVWICEFRIVIPNVCLFCARVKELWLILVSVIYLVIFHNTSRVYVEQSVPITRLWALKIAFRWGIGFAPEHVPRRATRRWVWDMDDVGYGLGQWDTALHCNVVSHWLGIYPE